MILVLLGAPASGKGTQAGLLAKKFNLYHFQTGSIARELAKTNPRIKNIVESGQLIPEEEMTMYAIDHLARNIPQMKDILFEGFPRFISQYEALNEYLKSKGDDIDAVISIEVGEEEAIRRIAARRTCNKCGRVYNLITNPPPKENQCECGGELFQRDDDKPEAIKTRFRAFKDNTKQLMDELDKKGILIKVDGERPIDEIQKDLVNIVGKVKDGQN